MNRHERIEQAIDACYDAIFAPSIWPNALHDLACALNAANMMFAPINPDRSSPDWRDLSRPFLISREYGALLGEYDKQKWYLNHYRAKRGLKLFEAGKVVVLETELATDAERRRIPVYNDLYIKLGFPDFAMAGFSENGGFWAVPVLKRADQGRFDENDAADIAALIPHLKRMVRFSEKLAVSRMTAGMHLLDQLSSAAILLDRSGSVIAVNASATSLLGGDLKVAGRRLVARHPGSNAALDRYVRVLTKSGSPNAPVTTVPVRIEREDKRPLLIEAMPASRVAEDVFNLAGSILIITDLENRPGSLEKRVRVMFDLTPAESRLCGRLVEGKSLSSAAEALRITLGTARSQLKTILAKTNTHRQGELMLLLSALRQPH